MPDPKTTAEPDQLDQRELRTATVDDRSRIKDSRIAGLQKMVTAARQEFDLAVMFHEVWKPAAYDSDLHLRMGKSYASHAFIITRTALRREMLLALVRLWDKSKATIRMEFVESTLRKDEVIEALALDRVRCIGFHESIDQMRVDLKKYRDEAVNLITKYLKDGSHAAVLDSILTMRHTQLAHRNLSFIAATGVDTTDEEIEEFYQDNSRLVEILLGLVNAMAYSPEDTAKVYRIYSRHFWAGARGEKTEGHPFHTRSMT